MLYLLAFSIDRHQANRVRVGRPSAGRIKHEQRMMQRRQGWR